MPLTSSRPSGPARALAVHNVTADGVPAHTGRGFTLVELLVVIGIIAALISVLLPALNRARDQANKVKCASNMKQIVTAMLMYVNENKGLLPASSGRPHAWLHWEQPATATRSLDTSALAPYVGTPVSGEVFRCPSDDVDTRASIYGGQYKYSYTMNFHISNTLSAAQIHPMERHLFAAGLKITRVRNPSEKIVFAEEDFATLNDGTWAPIGIGMTGFGFDWLASVHEKYKKPPTGETVTEAGISPGTDPALEARGNAAFCDGHVDFVTRRFAHQRKHVLYGE